MMFFTIGAAVYAAIFWPFSPLCGSSQNSQHDVFGSSIGNAARNALKLRFVADRRPFDLVGRSGLSADVEAGTSALRPEPLMHVQLEEIALHRRWCSS